VNFSNQNAPVYNDTVVRQFAFMTVIWGVVGMLVGLIIAAELTWPEISMGIPWLSYGRLRPRGLVRYATENAMEYGWTSAQMLRRVFRPRVLIYTALLWSLIGVVGLSLWLRTPLHVDVERDRSSLARIVEGGRIENVYRLQVMNASEAVDHVHIRVSGIEGLSLASDTDFVIDKAQSRWVPVRVQLPYDGAPPGSHPITFEITEPESGAQVMEKAVFLVPR